MSTSTTSKARGRSAYRVVLVDPAFPFSDRLPVQQDYEPYGIMMLAAALEASGFEVLYRAQAPGVDAARTAADVLADRPDAVGLSVYGANHRAGLALVAALRRAGFAGPVVLGGSHATALPELVADPAVDAVLCGEGEIAAPRLFSALAAGADVAGLPGVAVWRDGGLVAAPFELIDDLSSLPWALRGLVPARREYSVGAFGLQKAVIMTARGCTHACAFCSARYLSRGRVRFRDVTEVLAEVEALRSRHGRRFLSVMDDDFFASAEHVTAFCEAKLAAGEPLPFSCMGRVDGAADIDARLLARAGCRRVYFGVERAPGTSRWVAKAGDVPEVNAVLRRFAEAGIHTMAGFVLGLPDESEAHLAALRAYVLSLEADYAGMTIFTPFPRTPLYDHLRRHGLPCDPEADYAAARPGVRYGEVDGARLEQWRLATLRAFYLHPRYALRAGRRVLRRPGFAVDYARLFGKSILDGLFGSAPAPARSPRDRTR